MSKVLSIDLGTTNSAMAIFENGEPKIIANKEGKNTTPSIVAFTDKGEILVGETAKRQAITNPERTIDSIKRIMGLMYDEKKVKEADEKTQYKIVNKNGVACVEIAGKVYTPQEISSKILLKLKNDAEEYLGEKITDAVITVPAYFNDSQRKATKEAGTIAGLNVLRIINEPTAAALAYGLDKKKEETVLIVDIGGGTSDFSVLEVGDGTFEVLSTDGNRFLGGKDYDQKITEHLIKNFKDEHGFSLENDKMAMQRLMDASENAKKELSSTNETEINLPFISMSNSGPLHLTTKITKSKFEGLIEDLTKDIIPHLDAVLKGSGKNKNEINEIVMVGGSTRIPLVQQIVSDYFNGKQLNKSVNPDEIVALGAAVQGGVLKGDVKNVLLLDVTPLSLGLETMGSVMTKIIEKGTTIPVKKSQVFSTAEDNQSRVTISVYQGEREFARDNKNLGQFNLDGIPSAPRGVPQIEVTFDIDANGILTVSSKDKGTGKEQSITISGSSGLSEDEINRMIQEAEKNKEQDKKRAEIVKKRNELDTLVFSIRKQSKEMNVDTNSVPGLEDLLIKSENLVKEQREDLNEINDTINKLNMLVQQMNSQHSSCSNNGSCDNSNKQNNNDDVIDREVS